MDDDAQFIIPSLNLPTELGVFAYSKLPCNPRRYRGSERPAPRLRDYDFGKLHDCLYQSRVDKAT